MQEELKEALSLLTNEQYLYLMLNQMGISQQEIAETRGISSQSVHRTIERGRKKMKKRLLHIEAIAVIQEIFRNDFDKLSTEKVRTIMDINK